MPHPLDSLIHIKWVQHLSIHQSRSVDKRYQGELLLFASRHLGDKRYQGELLLFASRHLGDKRYQVELPLFASPRSSGIESSKDT